MWDYELDVVAVGYGGACSAAAITAHDAGVQVLILEKNVAGGDNTRISGGNVPMPITPKPSNIPTLCTKALPISKLFAHSSKRAPATPTGLRGSKEKSFPRLPL